MLCYEVDYRAEGRVTFAKQAIRGFRPAGQPKESIQRKGGPDAALILRSVAFIEGRQKGVKPRSIPNLLSFLEKPS
ncbi:hypothetical protein EDE11_11867 [Methylomonas methanica]|uniref:Uncharacterized protein n=2 Tax=Methylomonas TaxID=416 RepID=A0A126T177_9GAMM|nr:hypothetical protein JT25_004925 [Methylomonas denitrificans]OAH98589.1 hypothetical protein A1342_07540 [Methylomonas methanica]TCV80192.1 hypothetical protein EDE11_11867 [Methylomonas methanica]